VGESAEVSVESTDAWLESLPSLLEGYEPCDVYNADETGLFFNMLPDRTLEYKGESCMAENIPKTDSLCYYVLIVMEVTNKCRL
jgi:hypothetical protein